MAVVRRCQNGRWQGIVRRKGYPAQSRTFVSQADATKWARAVETQINSRAFEDRAPADRTTLAQAIERYLAEVTPPRKRSWRREAGGLRLLQYVFGDYTLVTLTRQAVAAFRDQRLAEGRAPATVVKDLNTLTHLLEVARRDWGYALPANPAKLVRRPSVGPGRNRRLSQAGYEQLVAACTKSRSSLLLPIVQLALETAMRLGELLSLRWEDVQGSSVRLLATKNGHPRTVPLSSRALEILADIPRHISDTRVFWCWKAPDGFENTWRRALARTDIRDLRFHDLRHEATSRLAEKIPNMIELAAITGHRHIQMLARYYHPKVEDLAKKLA